MKERIQRFYEDHKTGIVLGASAIAVAALVTMRKQNGHKLTSADIWQRSDGAQLISVTRRNGETTSFVFHPETV